MSTALPLTALIISAATLVNSAFALKQKASRDYVDSLHKEIQELREKVDECERARERLETENVRLMRQLYGSGANGAG